MASEANGSGEAPQPLPRRLVSIGLPLASLALVLIFLLILFPLRAASRQRRRSARPGHRRLGDPGRSGRRTQHRRPIPVGHQPAAPLARPEGAAARAGAGPSGLVVLVVPGRARPSPGGDGTGWKGQRHGLAHPRSRVHRPGPRGSAITAAPGSPGQPASGPGASSMRRSIFVQVRRGRRDRFASNPRTAPSRCLSFHSGSPSRRHAVKWSAASRDSSLCASSSSAVQCSR